jgi:hypothetical protein
VHDDGAVGSDELATNCDPADSNRGYDEFVHALLNGTAYANVHTTASPGGEIRGQIRVDRDNGQGNDGRDR